MENAPHKPHMRKAGKMWVDPHLTVQIGPISDRFSSCEEHMVTFVPGIVPTDAQIDVVFSLLSYLAIFYLFCCRFIQTFIQFSKVKHISTEHTVLYPQDNKDQIMHEIFSSKFCALNLKDTSTPQLKSVHHTFSPVFVTNKINCCDFLAASSRAILSMCG